MARELIDLYAVMQRIPEILGMELRWKKDAWEGQYYLTGERHPYKRDKLKVKFWRNDKGCSIWLHEQGGESMSLQNWLQRYGGAADWKEAMDIMRGNSRPDARLMDLIRTGGRSEKVRYVDQSEYDQFTRYEWCRCPLYNMMCRVFGSDAVSKTWSRYGVTTNQRGDAVYWYFNADGKICHDKIIRYRYDGRRDHTFGGSRVFTTAKGYTERCLFGSNLIRQGEPFFVVEGEKSALIAACVYPEYVWVASGGKNTLRDLSDEAVLFPDVDAYEDWEKYGRCVRWWDGWKGVGEKSDIADMLVDLKNRQEKIPDICDLIK